MVHFKDLGDLLEHRDVDDMPGNGQDNPGEGLNKPRNGLIEREVVRISLPMATKRMKRTSPAMAWSSPKTA